jgi:hypothetical protein
VLGEGNRGLPTENPMPLLTCRERSTGIKRISLKNETTGKMWSTSRQLRQNFCRKDEAQHPNVPWMPVTLFCLVHISSTTVNDAVTAIPKDSDFTVIETLMTPGRHRQDKGQRTRYPARQHRCSCSRRRHKGIRDERDSEHDSPATSEKSELTLTIYQFTLP